MRVDRFIGVRAGRDICSAATQLLFGWHQSHVQGRQHMKRATSAFFLLLGMVVPGQAAAIVQADAGSDSAMVPGTVFRDCPSCPEMVVVPAGTFIMGSPESEKGRLRAVYDEEGTAITWTSIDEVELPVEEGQRLVVVEGPQRYVTIEFPFAVGVYEVTFDEWDACARAGGCGGVIPDHEGWGPRTPAGHQRQLGRGASLCTLALAGDGARIPVAKRSGVGVRCESRHGDRSVLGRDSSEPVPVWERGRCPRFGQQSGMEDGGML